jgi:membrane protein
VILRFVRRKRKRRLLQKFFADRGTHLAAMIAYFALLSFVPLTFIALSLLGLTGRADESSFLVGEIRKTLPGVPIIRIVDLVNSVRGDAATLGLIGALALLWTSLSFFSVLESAFNIVYGMPNRGFLHGKGLAVLLMVGSLVTLFVALLAGSLGAQALRRYAPGVVGNGVSAYAVSLIVSSLGVFAFLLSAYYFLTNVELTVRNVLPGAVLATVLLQVTFQALPLYVRFAKVNPALYTFGGTAILLVWLFVMANVIVFGAELNWWRSCQEEEQVGEEAIGLA